MADPRLNKPLAPSRALGKRSGRSAVESPSAFKPEPVSKGYKATCPPLHSQEKERASAYTEVKVKG